MGLTQTRPEMSGAMTEMVQALCDAMTSAAAKDQMNLAETINSVAHLLASILVGAYKNDKEREIVVSTFPDVVRAYFPQWEALRSDSAKIED